MAREHDRTRQGRADEEPLGPLSELSDYKVADEDPDIRGWDVKSADGTRIGAVNDLIVDTRAMRVRYLDVELDGGALDLEEDRHLLVPIGRAQLAEDRDDVVVPHLSRAQFADLPAHRGGAPSREVELEVVNRWPGTRSAAPIADRDDRLYERDPFDESRFWGRRRAGRERDSYLQR